MRTLLLPVLATLFTTTAAQSPYWLPVGDMPGGVFTHLWTNPAGDLFLTSNYPVHKSDGNGGKLFRSTNGGLTWNDIGVPLGNEAVWAFAQHPTTGSLVVASQSPRDPLNPLVATRIHTSSDMGQSWGVDNSSTFSGDKPPFALSYDATGTWLYAAQRQTGMKRSNTNGTSWSAINTGLSNVNVKDLEWGAGGLLYTCTDSVAGNGGKVFSWNGTTWTDVSTGLPGGGIQDIVYDPTSLTLYAAVNSTGTLACKVYKRVYTGSWTVVSGYAGYAIDRMMLDAAGVLYLHGNHQGVYRYNGAWSTMNNGLVPLWGTACAATADGLFTATRVGMYKWNPGTNAWELLPALRSMATPLAITFGPNGEILAGTLHGVYRTADAGATWTQVALPEQTIMAVSYDALHNQYLSGTNNSTASESWRSTDGVNWSLGNTGFTSLRVLDYAYTPDGRILCGTGWQRPVSYSTNGISWSGSNATAIGFSAGTISLGLAVDNAGRIWSTTEAQGVYRSDDAVPTHFTHMGFTGGNAVDVRISPQQDAFVAHQLFGGGSDGNLYRWRNSTNSWVVPNNLLPAGTGLINSTLVLGNKDVYAGVQSGCYFSADTGATWTVLTAGLPPGNHIVQSLELGPDGHLYAGIAGAGIYRSAVPAGSNYVTLNAKVFLEGPFDGVSLMHDSLRTQDLIPSTEPFTVDGFAHAGDGGGEVLSRSTLDVTGNNAIVDWVLVELRNNAAPATVMATRSALLQRDGDVVELDGISPLIIAAAPGSYYVAMRHRNHLGVMTASTTALGAAPITIDFRNPVTSTFGVQAQKQIGSNMMLWAGNAFRDGGPSYLKYVGINNDRDPILVRIGGSTPTNTVFGYYPEDVNMDGAVKYVGGLNDRDPILVNIGGSAPTNTRTEQLP